MMQVTSCMEEQDGGTVVKRLSVPVGLEELMTGLTKEVLQKKPRDIYSFASDHFAQLLALRDNGNYQQAPTKSIAYASKENLESLLANGKTPPTKSSNGTPTKLPRQVSIRADSPTMKNGPKIKRSGTPKHECNNNDEGKIKDKQDKKKPVQSRRQTPGSKGKFDSLEPVKEDALKMLTKRESLSRRSSDRKSKTDSENSRDSKRSSSEESEKKKRPSRDASLKKKSSEKKVQSKDSKELKDKKNGQEKLKGEKEETKKKSVKQASDLKNTTKVEKAKEDPILGLQHSGETHDILIREDSPKDQSKDKSKDIKNEHSEKFILKSPSIEEGTTGIKDGRLTVTPPKILKEVQTSSDNLDFPTSLIVPVLGAASTYLNNQASPDQSTLTVDAIKTDLQENPETGEILSSPKDEDENKKISSKVYDPSALREELQKVEEESKLNNFTTSYNPYKLKQEIKNASKEFEEGEGESSTQPSADSRGLDEISKHLEGDKEKETEETAKEKEPEVIEEKGIGEVHEEEESHETIDTALQQLQVPRQQENNKLQLLHEQTAVSEGSTTGSIEGTSLENKEMPEEDSVEENKLENSSTVPGADDVESPVVPTSGLQHSGELHDQLISKKSDEDKCPSELEKDSTPEATPIVLESISGLHHSGELHDQLIPKESSQSKNENEIDKSTSEVPNAESPIILKSISGLQHSGELHDRLIPLETEENKNALDSENVTETTKPHETSSFALQHSGELHDQFIPKDKSEEAVQKVSIIELQHSGELHDALIPKQTNIEDGSGKSPSSDLKQDEPQDNEIKKVNLEGVEDKKGVEESLERPSSVVVEEDKQIVENAEEELKAGSRKQPKQETNETEDKLSIGETISQAASKIQAGVRGYLTRKLYKNKTPSGEALTNEQTDNTIPKKLSDEELQEALTQLDKIPIPSESPHTSRHKREVTPVRSTDIRMEDETGQTDKLLKSKTVHGVESEKHLIPNLFKSLSVTDSALSKTLDEDEEKMRDSTEDSVSLEHTEDLGIESEKSALLHSETVIENVEEEKIPEEASTASLNHPGELHDTTTDREIIEGKHDLGKETEKQPVLKNGKSVQEVELIPKESVSDLKEEPKMSPQLAATAELQHSGELHDILIPKEIEEEAQKVKILETESLQHSGELHDHLLPKEVEEIQQNEKAELSREIKDDKKLVKGSLQHSGELHDQLIPKDVEERLPEEQNVKNLAIDGIQASGKLSEKISHDLQNDLLQHSGELHDVMILNETEKTDPELQGDGDTNENLRHSGELHDLVMTKEGEEVKDIKNLAIAGSKLSQEISQELQADKTLIQDALQHSGELHDVLLPKEADKTGQELQDDDETKTNLQHSGEIHDLLIPKDVEETLQDATNVKNLAVEGSQISDKVSEEISQELQDGKALIQDALQHSGELHDVLIPKEADETDQELQDDGEKKANLQHSGEIHDLLIPKDVEETFQEVKDVKNLAVEGSQIGDKVSDEISQEFQDGKTLIQDAIQHSGELHDVLIPKEADETDQELQDETKENPQHSGEIHNPLMPKDVKNENVSDKVSADVRQELQDDKTLIQDALQHSGELHDVLVTQKAEKTDQELQDDDETKQNHQHKLHDPSILKDVEETLQEVKDVKNLAAEGRKVSDKDSEEISQELQEDKTSIQDALQHSGELHDALIAKEAGKTSQELQDDEKENLQQDNNLQPKEEFTKETIKDGSVTDHHPGEIYDQKSEVEEGVEGQTTESTKTTEPSLDDQQKDKKKDKKATNEKANEVDDAITDKVDENGSKDPTKQESGVTSTSGLEHSGELHDLVIPQNELLVKSPIDEGKFEEEIKPSSASTTSAAPRQDLPKLASTDGFQHSGEMHDLLIPQENLNKADINDESFTHSPKVVVDNQTRQENHEMQEAVAGQFDVTETPSSSHFTSLVLDEQASANTAAPSFEKDSNPQGTVGLQHTGELHDILIADQTKKDSQDEETQDANKPLALNQVQNVEVAKVECSGNENSLNQLCTPSVLAESPKLEEREGVTSATPSFDLQHDISTASSETGHKFPSLEAQKEIIKSGTTTEPLHPELKNAQVVQQALAHSQELPASNAVTTDKQSSDESAEDNVVLLVRSDPQNEVTNKTEAAETLNVNKQSDAKSQDGSFEDNQKDFDESKKAETLVTTKAKIVEDSVEMKNQSLNETEKVSDEEQAHNGKDANKDEQKSIDGSTAEVSNSDIKAIESQILQGADIDNMSEEGMFEGITRHQPSGYSKLHPELDGGRQTDDNTNETLIDGKDELDNEKTQDKVQDKNELLKDQEEEKTEAEEEKAQSNIQENSKDNVSEENLQELKDGKNQERDKGVINEINIGETIKDAHEISEISVGEQTPDTGEEIIEEEKDKNEVSGKNSGADSNHSNKASPEEKPLEDISEPNKSFDISKLRAELEGAGKEIEADKNNKEIVVQESNQEPAQKVIEERAQNEDQNSNISEKEQIENVSDSNTSFDISKLRAELEEAGKETEKYKTESENDDTFGKDSSKDQEIMGEKPTHIKGADVEEVSDQTALQEGQKDSIQEENLLEDISTSNKPLGASKHRVDLDEKGKTADDNLITGVVESKEVLHKGQITDAKSEDEKEREEENNENENSVQGKNSPEGAANSSKTFDISKLHAELEATEKDTKADETYSMFGKEKTADTSTNSAEKKATAQNGDDQKVIISEEKSSDNVGDVNTTFDINQLRAELEEAETEREGNNINASKTTSQHDEIPVQESVGEKHTQSLSSEPTKDEKKIEEADIAIPENQSLVDEKKTDNMLEDEPSVKDLDIAENIQSVQDGNETEEVKIPSNDDATKKKENIINETEKIPNIRPQLDEADILKEDENKTAKTDSQESQDSVSEKEPTFDISQLRAELEAVGKQVEDEKSESSIARALSSEKIETDIQEDNEERTHLHEDVEKPTDPAVLKTPVLDNKNEQESKEDNEEQPPLNVDVEELAKSKSADSLELKPPILDDKHVEESKGDNKEKDNHEQTPLNVGVEELAKSADYSEKETPIVDNKDNLESKQDNKKEDNEEQILLNKSEEKTVKLNSVDHLESQTSIGDNKNKPESKEDNEEQTPLTEGVEEPAKSKSARSLESKPSMVEAEQKEESKRDHKEEDNEGKTPLNVDMEDSAKSKLAGHPEEKTLIANINKLESKVNSEKKHNEEQTPLNTAEDETVKLKSVDHVESKPLVVVDKNKQESKEDNEEPTPLNEDMEEPAKLESVDSLVSTPYNVDDSKGSKGGHKVEDNKGETPLNLGVEELAHLKSVDHPEEKTLIANNKDNLESKKGKENEDTEEQKNEDVEESAKLKSEDLLESKTTIMDNNHKQKSEEHDKGENKEEQGSLNVGAEESPKLKSVDHLEEEFVITDDKNTQESKEDAQKKDNKEQTPLNEEVEESAKLNSADQVESKLPIVDDKNKHESKQNNEETTQLSEAAKEPAKLKTAHSLESKHSTVNDKHKEEESKGDHKQYNNEERRSLSERVEELAKSKSADSLESKTLTADNKDMLEPKQDNKDNEKQTPPLNEDVEESATLKSADSLGSKPSMVDVEHKEESKRDHKEIDNEGQKTPLNVGVEESTKPRSADHPEEKTLIAGNKDKPDPKEDTEKQAPPLNEDVEESARLKSADFLESKPSTEDDKHKEASKGDNKEGDNEDQTPLNENVEESAKPKSVGQPEEKTLVAVNKDKVESKEDNEEQTPLHEDVEEPAKLKSADSLESQSSMVDDEHEEEFKRDHKREDNEEKTPVNVGVEESAKPKSADQPEEKTLIADNKDKVESKEDNGEQTPLHEGVVEPAKSKSADSLESQPSIVDDKPKDESKGDNKEEDNEEQTPLNVGVEESAKPKSTDQPEEKSRIADNKDKLISTEDNEEQTSLNEGVEDPAKSKSADSLESKPSIVDDKHKEESKGDNQEEDNEIQTPLNVGVAESAKPKSAEHSEEKTLIADNKDKLESRDDNAEQTPTLKEDVEESETLKSAVFLESKPSIVDDKHKEESLGDNKEEDNEGQTSLNVGVEELATPKSADQPEDKTLIADNKDKLKSKEDNEEQTLLNEDVEEPPKLKSANSIESKTPIMDDKDKQESKQHSEKGDLNHSSEEKTDSEKNQVTNIPLSDLNSTTLALNNVLTPTQSADRNSQNSLPDESFLNVYKSAPTRPATSDITPNIIPNENIQIPSANLHKHVQDIEQIIKPDIKCDEKLASEVENFNENPSVEESVEMKKVSKTEGSIKGNKENEEQTNAKGSNKEILLSNKTLSNESLNDQEVNAIDAEQAIGDDNKITVEEDGERPVSITSTTSTDSVATVITASPRERSNERKETLSRSLSNSSEKSEDSKTDTQIDKMSNTCASVLIEHTHEKEEGIEKQETGDQESDSKDITTEKGDHENTNEIENLMETTKVKAEGTQLGKEEASSKSSPQVDVKDLKAQVIDNTVKQDTTVDNGMLKNDDNLDNYNFQQSQESPEIDKTRQAAATTIQSSYRGFRVRRDLGKYNLSMPQEESPFDMEQKVTQPRVDSADINEHVKQTLLQHNEENVSPSENRDKTSTGSVQPLIISSDAAKGRNPTIANEDPVDLPKSEIIEDLKIERASSGKQSAKSRNSTNSNEDPVDIPNSETSEDVKTGKASSGKRSAKSRNSNEDSVDLPKSEISDNAKTGKASSGKRSAKSRNSKEDSVVLPKSEIIEDVKIEDTSSGKQSAKSYNSTNSNEDSVDLPKSEIIEDVKIENTSSGKQSAKSRNSTISNDDPVDFPKSEIIEDVKTEKASSGKQSAKSRNSIISNEDPVDFSKSEITEDVKTGKASSGKRSAKSRNSTVSNEDPVDHSQSEIIEDIKTEKASSGKRSAKSRNSTISNEDPVDFPKSEIIEDVKTEKASSGKRSAKSRNSTISNEDPVDFSKSEIIKDVKTGKASSGKRSAKSRNSTVSNEDPVDHSQSEITEDIKTGKASSGKRSSKSRNSTVSNEDPVDPSQSEITEDVKTEKASSGKRSAKSRNSTISNEDPVDFPKSEIIEDVKTEKASSGKRSAKSRNSTISNEDPVDFSKSEIIKDVKTGKASSGKRSAKIRNSTVSNEDPVDHSQSEITEDIKTGKASSGKRSSKSRNSTVSNEDPVDPSQSEITEDVKTEKASSGKRSAKSRNSTVSNEDPVDFPKSEIIEDVKTEKVSSGKRSAKSRNSTVSNEDPVDHSQSEITEDIKTGKASSGKRSAKSRNSTVSNEDPVDPSQSEITADVKTEKASSGKRSAKSRNSTISNEDPVDFPKSEIIEDVKTEKVSSGKRSAKSRNSIVSNEDLVHPSQSEITEDVKTGKAFSGKRSSKSRNSTISNENLIDLQNSQTKQGVKTNESLTGIVSPEEDNYIGITPHVIATAPPLHLLDNEDDYDFLTDSAEHSSGNEIATGDPYKNATAPPITLLDDPVVSREQLLLTPSEKHFQSSAAKISSPVKSIKIIPRSEQALLSPKKSEEKIQQSSTSEIEPQKDLSEPSVSSEKKEDIPSLPRKLDDEEVVGKLGRETKNVDHTSPKFHIDPAGAVPKATVLDEQLATAAPNAEQKQESNKSKGPEYINIPLKEPVGSSDLQHSGELHGTIGIPPLSLNKEEEAHKKLNLDSTAAHVKELQTTDEINCLAPVEDFSSSKYDLVGSGPSPRTHRGEEEEGVVPKALGVVLDQQLAITAPKAEIKQENSKSEDPQYIHIPLKGPTEASTSTETTKSRDASTSGLQHTGELHDTMAILKDPLEDARSKETSKSTEASTSGLQHTGELHDTIAIPLLDLKQEEQRVKTEHEKESKTQVTSDHLLDDFTSSKYDLVESGVTPRIRKEEEGAVPKALGTILDQQLAITTPRAEEKREGGESQGPEYIHIPLKDSEELSTSAGLQHSGESHDTIVVPLLKDKQKEENPATDERHIEKKTVPVHKQKVEDVSDGTLDKQPDAWDSSKYDLVDGGTTPRIRKEQEGAVPKVLGAVLDQQLAITTPLGKPKEEKSESVDPKYIYIPLKDSSEEGHLRNGVQVDEPSTSQKEILTNGFEEKHPNKPTQENKLTNGFQDEDKTSKVVQLTNGHHSTNSFLEKELKNELQGNEELNTTTKVSPPENQSLKAEKHQNELPVEEIIKSSSAEDKSSSLSPASSSQYSLDASIPPTPGVEETSILGQKVEDLEKPKEPLMEKISMAKFSSADIKHTDQIDSISEVPELAPSPTISSYKMENSPTVSSLSSQPFLNQVNGGSESKSSMLSPPSSSLSLDPPSQDLRKVGTPILGLHLRASPSPTQNLEGRSKSISPNSEKDIIYTATDDNENLNSAREDRSVQSESPPIVIQSTQISDSTMPLAVQLNQAPGAAVLTSPTSNDDDDDDAGELIGAHAPGKGASTKVEARKNRAHFRTSMETGKRKNATIKQKNMEEDAATKIQAGFRGYQVRKQLKLKNGGVDSIRRSLRRKSSGKLRGSDRVSQKVKPSDLEEKSATKIQAGIRGFLVRRRQQKKAKNNTTPESS